jgi:UDP-glucose 4,6-dehydratase
MEHKMMQLQPRSSSEVYDPQCVLVTGGAGFIASHVVLRLVRNYPDIKVVVFDKLDYCASVNNLRAVRMAPNFKFVKGDIQVGRFLCARAAILLNI